MGQVMRFPSGFQRLTSQVRRTSGLTVDTGGTLVPWQAVDVDDLGAAPAIGGSRLTAPATGSYFVTMQGISFQSSTKATQAEIRVNGVTVAKKTHYNANRDNCSFSLSRALRMTAGQYAELWVHCGGGVGRSMSAGRASMIRLG